MTTLSASPASLAIMSPYYAREGPIHTSLYQPLHEPSSSTKQPQQTSQIDPPSSPSSHTLPPDETGASTPCPQLIASIADFGFSASGSGFTPLNSTLASRVASMSQLEASKAEIALGKDVRGQYDRDKPSGHGRTAFRRDRAFSAPEGTVNMDLRSKALKAEQVGVDLGSAHPIADKMFTRKPTAQEWVSDIDCVSDVLGAMLADGDRGGR